MNSTTTTAGASKDPPNAMHFEEASSSEQVNQIVQPKPQTKKEASSAANWSHLPLTTMTNSFKEKVFKHSQIRKLQVQKSIQQDQQAQHHQQPQGGQQSAPETATPATTPQLHQMGGGTGGTSLAALQNSSNSHSLSNMSTIVQTVGNTANNLTNTNITSDPKNQS